VTTHAITTALKIVLNVYVGGKQDRPYCIMLF